jgi:hypothetical protein
LGGVFFKKKDFERARKLLKWYLDINESLAKLTGKKTLVVIPLMELAEVDEYQY